MRIGKTKRPYYRIVVLDKRDPRDGAYIDCLGHYQPIEDASKTNIDLQKYDEWIKKGAKASFIVRDIVRRMRKSV
jgi:small subunit ribosomal protein S16